MLCSSYRFGGSVMKKLSLNKDEKHSSLKIALETLHRTYFGADSLSSVKQQYWREYTTLANVRDYHSLIKLLSEDIADTYKGAVLNILLSFHQATWLFYWNSIRLGGPIGPLGFDVTPITTLPQAVVEYAVETIKVIVAEISIFDEENSNMDQWLIGYDRYLFMFLGLLPKDSLAARMCFYTTSLMREIPLPPGWKARIFDGFRYGAFTTLFHEEAVADKWKREGDMRMRERVAEYVRTQGPVAMNEYFGLLCRYKEVVVNEWDVCDSDLFASQIQFLLDLEESKEMRGTRILKDADFDSIVRRIPSSESYRELRLRLARQVFLPLNREPHRVRSFEELALIESVATEAAELDSNLSEALLTCVNIQRQRLVQENEVEEENFRKKQEILACMRQS